MDKSKPTQNQVDRHIKYTHTHNGHVLMSSPPLPVLHLRRVGRCWSLARLIIRAPVSNALLYNVYDTCTTVIYFCWFSELPLKPATTAQFGVDKGKHVTMTVILVAF